MKFPRKQNYLTSTTKLADKLNHLTKKVYFRIPEGKTKL